MITRKDLEIVPDSWLKEEQKRRLELKRALRKQAAQEAHSCKNCAIRMQGYSTIRSYTKKWICSKRSKKVRNLRSGERCYYVCSPKYKNNCEFWKPLD